MFKVVVLLCFLAGVQLCRGSDFNVADDQQPDPVSIETEAEDSASSALTSDVDYETPGLRSARGRALGNLKEHSLIRLRVNDAGILIGNFLRYQDNTVTIFANSIEKSVDEPAVSALWVRGRATWTGALVGTIVGCAGGLITGYLWWKAAEGTDVNITGGGVAFLSAVGAVGGGLLGAGIGSAVPKWHLKFESHGVPPATLSNRELGPPAITGSETSITEPENAADTIKYAIPTASNEEEVGHPAMPEDQPDSVGVSSYEQPPTVPLPEASMPAEDTTSISRSTVDPRTGGIVILFGYATSFDGLPRGSFGGEICLNSRIGQSIMIGPEIGYYRFEPERFRSSSNDRAIAFGRVVVSVELDRLVNDMYAVAGTGIQYGNALGLGYTFGIGLTAGTASSNAAGVSRHACIQQLEAAAWNRRC